MYSTAATAFSIHRTKGTVVILPSEMPIHCPKDNQNLLLITEPVMEATVHICLVFVTDIYHPL